MAEVVVLYQVILLDLQHMEAELVEEVALTLHLLEQPILEEVEVGVSILQIMLVVLVVQVS